MPPPDLAIAATLNACILRYNPSGAKAKPMTKLTNYIRRYTSVSALIDTLARKKLTLLSPETWDDRNDRYFMALYREKKNLKKLSAMCATNVTETYHHWRVFSGLSDGACLVIKRKKLEAAFQEVAGVRYGEIEYLKLEELRSFTASTEDIDRLPFVKRAAFKDEGEYRVTFESDVDDDEPYQLPIEPSWIDRVQLNPWMPSALVETITNILTNLDGFSDLEVRRSYLIDSDSWKGLGDRIVGANAKRKGRRPAGKSH